MKEEALANKDGDDGREEREEEYRGRNGKEWVKLFCSDGDRRKTGKREKEHIERKGRKGVKSIETNDGGEKKKKI